MKPAKKLDDNKPSDNDEIYNTQGDIYILSLSGSNAKLNISQHRQNVFPELAGKYEALLNQLFERSPICIAITDLDGRYLFVNLAFCQTLGYSRDKMLNLTFVDISFPDPQEIEANLELRRKLLAGDLSEFQMEKRFMHRDGHVIHTILQLSITRNTQNAPLFFIGQIVDISERKQAEEALRLRLGELEIINNLSSTLRMAQTEEELLELILDKTLETLGKTVGEIDVLDTLTHKLRARAQRGWIGQMKVPPIAEEVGICGNVITSGELHLTGDLKDDLLVSGKFRQVSPSGWRAACAPLSSAKEMMGVLAVFFSTANELTEGELRLLNIFAEIGGNAIYRNRMHESLQHSFDDLQRETSQRRNIQALLAKEKEMLSVSLLSISEGVISIGLDGMINLFNRAAENVIGCEVDEALGQPIKNIFCLLDYETNEIIADPVQYLMNVELQQMTDPAYRPPTLVTRDGQKLLISGSVSPVRSKNNQVVGNIIIFSNVTEKQRQEAQSSLSQKMEAIGQLAAGIAHEINTPIQYVGANIDYLNRAFTRFSELIEAYQHFIEAHNGTVLSQDDLAALQTLRKDKKIDRYLEEIPNAIQESQDGIERVRKIVFAIREFSHPSEKEKKLADINQGILTTITISRNEWKYHADMETDLDPDVPLVWCQIDEINQVVLNMIVNAAQAIQEVLSQNSDQKGKITICTRRNDNKAQITIRDTGGGIPPEIHSRIFDPFFTTKGVGKGTGQGLSLAHNIIVKKHHGAIFVESEVGKGTAFIIDLPIGSEETGVENDPA